MQDAAGAPNTGHFVDDVMGVEQCNMANFGIISIDEIHAQ
jgi:hypothetical protein